MSNVSNVTAGKPNIEGAIYWAPLGTTLPDDTEDALTSFTELGYASEDGITNTNSPESEVIRAWGGDLVLTVQSSKDDIFKVKLIEALKADVLKAVYGEDNVDGSLASGMALTVNAQEAQAASWVFDMIMRDGTKKRIVIPNAKITELGDIVYADNEVVGYEITLTCLPDEDGNNHYEYFLEAQSE